MDVLRIETLGGLNFFVNGEKIKISRRKAAALLVYLAINQLSYTREILAGAFWPNNDLSRAYANLRQAIWDIKRTLGEDWLLTEDTRITLGNAKEIQLDVEEFNKILSGVSKHKHRNEGVCATCKAELEAAAAMLNGDFLAGFSLKDSLEFEDWQFFQADEVRRKTQRLYDHLIDVYVEEGKYEDAIHYARKWLRMDDLNEETHRNLMRLYAQNGQRNLALRQYEKCETTLDEELGVTPESETVDLYQAILAGEFELQKAKPSPASQKNTTLRVVHAAMPVYNTAFIGRRKERMEIVGMLEQPEVRLLTIIAPGGMGKTRLAITTAEELEPQFTDGVFFVPFAALDSSTLIANYLAEAIGFDARQGRSVEKQLSDFFHEKSVLLVLDNLEHLLEGVSWLGDLLAYCPDIKILATSRVSLELQAETRFHLSGLQLPTATTAVEDYNKFSAIKLFLQNARRVCPGFKPEKGDWEQIGQICRMVGGMPLGIQMASAWIEMLPPEEILAEIQQGMEIFEMELQDVPQRQRSIQTVFDYSWRMLSDKEQKLFSQLSLFRGGFTRSVAQAITGATLRQLVSLVNRSLLVRTDDDRFEIHELLRQYGYSKLQDNTDLYEMTQQQYVEYYCQALARWEPEYSSPRQLDAFAEVDEDFENIRQAWQWAVDLKGLDLLELSIQGMMLYLWRRRRFLDGIEIAKYTFSQLMGYDEKNIRLMIQVSGWLFFFKAFSANMDSADEIFAICENFNSQLQVKSEADKFARAMFHFFHGLYISFVGAGVEKRQDIYFKKALPLFSELGANYWKAQVYLYLAKIWYLENPIVIEYFISAERICRELGDTQKLAEVLSQQATILLYKYGELEQAEMKFNESIALYQMFDDQDSKHHLVYCKEHIANMYGRFTEVIDYREKNLEDATKRGEKFLIAEISMLLGESYHHIGNYQPAKDLGRIGLDIFRKEYKNFLSNRAILYYSLTLIALGEYEEALTLISELINSAVERGVKTVEGICIALRLTINIHQGDGENNETLMVEGIKQKLHGNEVFIMFYVLAAAALFMAKNGLRQEALDLYAKVHCWPFVANSQWFTDVYKEPLLELTQAKERELNTDVERSKDTLWQAAEEVLKRFEV